MPAVTAIDLGALTATIRGDATTRVATMIATTLTNLEEDGRGLNEIRTAKLMENAVYFFDGSGSTTSTPQSGSSTNSAIRSRGTTDTTR